MIGLMTECYDSVSSVWQTSYNLKEDLSMKAYIELWHVTSAYSKIFQTHIPSWSSYTLDL